MIASAPPGQVCKYHHVCLDCYRFPVRVQRVLDTCVLAINDIRNMMMFAHLAVRDWRNYAVTPAQGHGENGLGMVCVEAHNPSGATLEA